MDQTPEKKELNLDDILLPTKEVRTPASAERQNAGVLLTQEQTAELPKAPAPEPIQKPAPEVGPVDQVTIRPLETYQSDMETVISQKNLSAVSIAAAEAERMSKNAATQSVSSAAKTNWSLISKIVIIGSGVSLVLAAIAVVSYAFLRPAPSVVILESAPAPFIAVDSTDILAVTPEQLKRETLIGNLDSIRQKIALSVGLIGRVYVSVSTTTPKKGEVPLPISAQELLTTIAPSIPQELVRSISPSEYLLGTHVFDGNQEFIIMRVDSYEQAFSGMLAWESTMQKELYPLFSRTPRPRIASEVSSSTPTTAALFATPFRDKIVSNHDARVILSDAGDILLLWSFIDRNTLVITTNSATFSEIISRRSTFTP